MEFPLIDRDEVFVSRDRHILPPSEREAYRAEHHEAMKKRAESMGLSLPDHPSNYGPGFDRGGPGYGYGSGGPGYWGPGYAGWAGTIVAATRLIMTIVALLLGRS